MNPASTSFVLGYHGCDRGVAGQIISGAQSLQTSENDYDWLGDGIYFWEHNAHRAFDFASEVRGKPRNARQRIKEPAVVGAIIDLGFCLNLLDGRFIRLVKQTHDDLIRLTCEAGGQLPNNSVGDDLIVRELDCAVIRFLHTTRAGMNLQAFDTVRAAFMEGDRLYSNAGFAAKNHIQICVRNPACIKGYFRPLDDDGRPLSFE